MRIPQVRMTWLIAFVALAALDLVIVRMDWDRYGSFRAYRSAGIIPMLTFLATGLFVYEEYPKARGFLLGFEILGMMALGNYFAVDFSNDSWAENYLDIAREPLLSFIGRSHGITFRFILAYGLLACWATLPQLIPALFGGFMTRNFEREEGPEIDDLCE